MIFITLLQDNKLETFHKLEKKTNGSLILKIFNDQLSQVHLELVVIHS